MTASVLDRGRPLLTRGRAAASDLGQRMAPLAGAAARRARRLAPYARWLTPLGRGLLLTGVVAWVAGWRLGWVELFLAAAACLLAVAVSVPFVLGRTVLQTRVEVDPLRVTVGTPTAGRLVVRNSSRRRLLPLQVDLPVGTAVARFDVPSLGGEQVHDEVFVVPTQRRAVVPIGPASSVQSDPLGLLSREASDSEHLELFVHPVVVPLPPTSSGLLRDLEGQTTRDLSMSDLAFHALRDYVPGDDRRYVHWRSSAKADRLLVRQFLDTRRSRVAIAVDADRNGYADEEEFETAISVAASMGVRCVADELEVTLVAGGQSTTPRERFRLLDSLSRSEMGGAERGLGAAAAKASSLATDASLVVLVTGSLIPFVDLRGAANRFGPEAVPVAVRVEPDAPAGISVSGGLTVLAVRTIGDLPIVLTGAAS